VPVAGIARRVGGRDSTGNVPSARLEDFCPCRCCQYLALLWSVRSPSAVAFTVQSVRRVRNAGLLAVIDQTCHQQHCKVGPASAVVSNGEIKHRRAKHVPAGMVLVPDVRSQYPAVAQTPRLPARQ